MAKCLVWVLALGDDLQVSWTAISTCLSMLIGFSIQAEAVLTLIGDKALPTAYDNSEVARSKKQRCYPHTGNGDHSRCLSSGLTLSVGFSIQDEAVDVARSAPQGVTTMRTLFTCPLNWE